MQGSLCSQCICIDSGCKTIRARHRRGKSTSFAATGGSVSPEERAELCLRPEDESYCTAGDPQICPVRTSFFNIFFLSTLRAGDDTLGSLPFCLLLFRSPPWFLSQKHFDLRHHQAIFYCFFCAFNPQSSKFVVSATRTKELHADSSAHWIVNGVVRIMAQFPACLRGSWTTSVIQPCNTVHLTNTTGHILSIDTYTVHQLRSVVVRPSCQHRSSIAVPPQEPWT
jgi:hypothetical protein